MPCTLTVGRGARRAVYNRATGILYAPFARLANVNPTGGKVGAVPIHSPDVAEGVIAALHDGGGQFVETVEVGHAGVEALGTVAVSVAPAAGVALHFVATCGELSVGVVPNGFESFARCALEDGEELLAIGHIAFAVDVGRGVVRTLDVVVARFGHIIALTIGGTSGGAADELSFAIAIEVVDQKLHVVVARADVVTQIDVLAPKLGAVHLVGLKNEGAGDAILTTVAGIVGQPFEHNLVVAIAIEVGNRHIVGTIATREAARAALDG